MKFLLPILALLLFANSISYSQNNYDYSTYNQEQGLSSSTFSIILKDPAGFIWIGSERGLNRFDGYDFKTYYESNAENTSKSLTAILSMQINSIGTVLIRTINSICLLDKKRGTYSPILGLNSRSEFANLHQFNNRFLLIKDKEIIYFDKYGKLTNTLNVPIKHFNNNFTTVTGDSSKLWAYNDSSFFVLDIASQQITTFAFPLLKTIKKQSTNINLHCYAYGKEVRLIVDFSYHCRLNNNTSKMEPLGVLSFPNNSTEKLAPIELIKLNEQLLVFYEHQNNLYSMEMATGKIAKIISLESSKTPVFINALFKSNDHSIYIGTNKDGIYRVDILNKQADQLQKRDENTGTELLNNVEALLNDNLVTWMCSPGNGLVKVERKKQLLQTSRPHSPFLDSKDNDLNTRCFANYEKNQILVGTLNGLSCYNYQTKTYSNTGFTLDGKSVFDNMRVSSILYDTSGFCLVSEWDATGVYKINTKTKKAVSFFSANTFPLAITTIRSIFKDSKNNLWIGASDDYVFRMPYQAVIDGTLKTTQIKKIRASNSSNQKVQMKLIFTFAENKKGAIFIASESGLFVYDYLTDSVSVFLNNPKNNNSISNNNVRALYVDQQDNLWIGTFGGGLNYYDSKKHHFIAYNTENGLLDNTVYSICPDLKNNLWLGTNKGLCCFNRRTKTSTYLTVKDGIQNYEFNTNASLSLKSGLLFIGGIRGINMFFSDSVKTPVVNNKIIISKFLINDVEHEMNDSVIELAYNQNYLVIHFAGLGYYRNNEYSYAYQLVGIDTTWNYCGYQRQVNYANLAPGKYVFKVKVSDCYGNWTYSDKLLSFKINRPWFKTWWFYLIIVSIISLLIFGMIQFRFQQIVALQTIRNDIARDLHDEVGSNLSNISLFNAVASEKAKNLPEVLPILTKISEYAQLSQESMSDIVWMINSDNDSLENLTTKIRNYTDTVIENTAIVATFQITPEANKIALNMLQRKNLFLLFKEALNNSIKHSKCSAIFIALEIENNFLVLRFKDNGVGFDTALVKTGNGLLNFKKRINELKGQLEVVSSPENGVLITFKIPVL